MKQHIVFQRLEGLAIFLTFTYFYSQVNFSWWWFFIGFAAVDLFIAGYLFSDKAGALVYNVGHSLIFPCFLLALSYALTNTTLIATSYIWFAHVGLDRTLGYGLKLQGGFKHTHLGKIGH